MSDSNNIDVFLNEHKIEPIDIGKSGASVYSVDETMILKHVKRDNISEQAVWNSYKMESLMYDWFIKKKISFVPQILYNHQTDDEIILLMKKYRMLRQDEINEVYLRKIIKLLVQIHNLPIPNFLTGHNVKPFSLTDKEIKRCQISWMNVLNEHGDSINKLELEYIANNINEVNQKNFIYQIRFVHGDFHCNNILVNENDEILVCDWQNTGAGDFIGDLSFFISRLSADGYVQREDEIIQLYVVYANEFGFKISENDIKVSMCLANINTTFLYWHNYLHDSSLERVILIYDKMILDMKWLLHKHSS